MSEQSKRSTGSGERGSSPWFQKALQILAEDGLGEELVGDVLRGHRLLTERSRRELAGALRTVARGAAVSQDLTILVQMARPLAQKGGFRKQVMGAPRLAMHLVSCWAEIHAAEIGSIEATLPSLRVASLDAILQQLRPDARGAFDEACSRVSLSPRRGLMAVGAICLRRSSGGGTSVVGPVVPPEAAKQVYGTSHNVSGDQMASSKAELSTESDAAGGRFEESPVATGSVPVSFQDETLQGMWTALAAQACDAALWDEGTQFLDAMTTLVVQKISERESLCDTVIAAVETLSREHGAALIFLRLRPLAPPSTLPSRKIPAILALVQDLSSYLAEHASRRQLLTNCTDFEEEARTLAELKAVRDRVSDVYAQLSKLFEIAPDRNAVEKSDEQSSRRSPRGGDIGGGPATQASSIHDQILRSNVAFAEVDSPVSLTAPEAAKDSSSTPTSKPTGSIPARAEALRDVALELKLNRQRAAVREEESNIMLCLDFGTARSKAFATRSVAGVTEPIPLAIGEVAATGEPSLFSLGSSVWIDEEHRRIYFGQKAVERSHLATRPGRRRIDSFKDQLNQAQLVGSELRNPIAKLVSNSHIGSNPTDVPFSQGDILLLFLGYLTWTAEESLRRNGMGSGYVRRRFALPSWDDAKKTAGTKLLRRYMAGAQIVADSVGDQWAHGLPVEQAKRLTDAVFQLTDDTLPLELLGEGILEPIAAAATRIEIKQPQRRLVMVIDVGAGTTDYATFVIQEDPSEGVFRMTPISFHTWNTAGNRLDDYLRGMLLDRIGQSNLRELHSEQIELRQRQYKETLFNTGTLSIVLGDGAHVVTLTSQEFLAHKHVVDFSETLEAQMDAALQKAGVDDKNRFVENGLLVVLTGGGANLPMVKSLAEGYSNKPVLRRRRAPLLPDDVPVNIAPEYLQLAVAWGGSMPDLPEVGRPITLPRPPVALPDERRLKDLMAEGSANWRNEPH